MYWQLLKNQIITENEFKALIYLKVKETPEISFSELSRFCGFAIMTAKAVMEKLREKKIIAYDEPQNGKWDFAYRLEDVKCCR